MIGEYIYHVAGRRGEPEYIEKWIDYNSNLTKETKQLIDGYVFKPEVFAVTDDYCN